MTERPSDKCEWCWDMCKDVDADSEVHPELCRACSIKKLLQRETADDIDR